MAESRGFDTLARLRQLLLAILALGLLGTLIELVLLEHTDEWTQWIPIVLLGLGLAGCAAVAVRPSHGVVQLFRVLMGLFIVAGLLGLALHYRGNVEFELEMRPSLGGLELFRKAMTGATPALAPGSMITFGLLGLLYAFRHPAVHETRGRRRDE